jgi:hypothetical protein
MGVGLNPAGFSLVEGLESANEENDRDVAIMGVLLYVLAEFIPVLAGHENIGEHKIRVYLTQSPLRHLAVTHRDDLYPLIGKGEVNNLLNSNAVVRK